jgi:hypothetical protein
MKIKITVEKVITNDNKVVTFSTAQDQHLEGNNIRFYSGPSAKLVVLQFVRGGSGVNQYFTDLAWSSVPAILDAAPTTGQWVLT